MTKKGTASGQRLAKQGWLPLCSPQPRQPTGWPFGETFWAFLMFSLRPLSPRLCPLNGGDGEGSWRSLLQGLVPVVVIQAVLDPRREFPLLLRLSQGPALVVAGEAGVQEVLVCLGEEPGCQAPRAS